MNWSEILRAAEFSLHKIVLVTFTSIDSEPELEPALWGLSIPALTVGCWRMQVYCSNSPCAHTSRGPCGTPPVFFFFILVMCHAYLLAQVTIPDLFPVQLLSALVFLNKTFIIETWNGWNPWPDTLPCMCVWSRRNVSAVLSWQRF